MEVIYSGLEQTPEMVVRTAIQEDVDVVGLSSLAAAHMSHFSRVLELLCAEGASDKLVLGGGVIPERDAEKLRAMGDAAARLRAGEIDAFAAAEAVLAGGRLPAP